ncbi:hypothetical protein MLD38_012054 [Melastoma candidum]|uniref:Uncharacterized protein n=1 Tax=Melastoma candidum TaxID=119954 RepID=A0ACB9R539_9MYRT|nr:hypothetical protein MLD38_012054 [Melastoma candidum]
MASTLLDSPYSISSGETFGQYFNLYIEGAYSVDISPVTEDVPPPVSQDEKVPRPPIPPSKAHSSTRHAKPQGCSLVPSETVHIWDSLFVEGFGADVGIVTAERSMVWAHSSVLRAASPVFSFLMQYSKASNAVRHIKMTGIPHDAVFAFIRFIYSSCYQRDAMEKYVLHLLVLSHAYSVPQLKRVCTSYLEHFWLTKENVIDILQLAKYCDAPRLTFVCIHMILKDFKAISMTEGWKVMRRASPAIEQEILEAVVEADSRKEERLRRMEERKVYLQLNDAMEALLHICQDGCKTIGPRDKSLNTSQDDCKFPACKGLETLVRHFSSCKIRVPVGCVHCKRMWQLFELHSRICDEPDSCKVPLCRQFKEKMKRQSKKDQGKWRMLVNKVIAARNSLGPRRSSLP